jgi:hypothetical protein
MTPLRVVEGETGRARLARSCVTLRRPAAPRRPRRHRRPRRPVQRRCLGWGRSSGHDQQRADPHARRDVRRPHDGAHLGHHRLDDVAAQQLLVGHVLDPGPVELGLDLGLVADRLAVRPVPLLADRGEADRHAVDGAGGDDLADRLEDRALVHPRDDVRAAVRRPLRVGLLARVAGPNAATAATRSSGAGRGRTGSAASARGTTSSSTRTGTAP